MARTTGERVARAEVKPLLQLVVLALGNCLLTFVLCAVVPATPQIAAHFSGQKDAVLMAQILLVGPTIPQIVAAPLVGQIIGRLGRRWPLLISLAALGLSGGAGFIVDNYWTLLTLRLISGFSSSAIATIGATLAGDYFTGRLRDRAVSWLGMMPSAGGVISLLLGGYLTKLGGWHYPFLLFLAALPVLALAFFVIDEPAVSQDAGLSIRLNEPSRLPEGMWPLILFMLIASIGFLVLSVQLPFLMLSLHIDNPTIASDILATAAVAATLSAFAYPTVKRRLGGVYVMVILFFLFGLGYVGLGNANNVAFIWICALISGAGAGLVIPLFTGLTMDRASPAVRPRAMGLLMGALFLGEFITPFVTEPIRALMGSKTVFDVCGLSFVALSVCIFLARARFSGMLQGQAAALHNTTSSP